MGLSRVSFLFPRVLYWHYGSRMIAQSEVTTIDMADTVYIILGMYCMIRNFKRDFVSVIDFP